MGSSPLVCTTLGWGLKVRRVERDEREEIPKQQAIEKNLWLDKARSLSRIKYSLSLKSNPFGVEIGPSTNHPLFHKISNATQSCYESLHLQRSLLATPPLRKPLFRFVSFFLPVPISILTRVVFFMQLRYYRRRRKNRTSEDSIYRFGSREFDSRNSCSTARGTGLTHTLNPRFSHYFIALSLLILPGIGLSIVFDEFNWIFYLKWKIGSPRTSTMCFSPSNPLIRYLLMNRLRYTKLFQ